MLRHASLRLTRLPVVLVLPLSRQHATAKVINITRQYRPSSPPGNVSPSVLVRNAGTVTSKSSVSELPPPQLEVLASSTTTSPFGWGIGPEKADIFSNILPKLAAGLQKDNVAAIIELWRLLEQNSLLPLLGPVLNSKLSSFAERIISAADRVPLSPSEWQGLDDIAVFTAAYGDTHGLYARMLHHILGNNPDAAILLFTRLKHIRNSNLVDIEPDASAPSQGDESSTIVERIAVSEVQPAITCLTVLAFAMKDSFSAAVRAIVPNTPYLTNTSVKMVFSNPSLDFLAPELRDKAKSFARRIGMAKVFSQPSFLQKRVAYLSETLSDRVLELIHTEFISSLSEAQPWLTLDPSAVSEQTPVLLPDFVWSIFLRAYLHCNRLDLAEKLWDDMSKFGVQPTMDTWTALLDGYAELRLIDRALAVWNMLQQQKLRPSVMAHRALILGLFKARYVDEAMQHFSDFQQLLEKGVYPLNDPAVLVVYNTTLFQALACHREPQAQAIFEMMQEAGPKPDVVTYNTFMQHYRTKGEPGAIGATLRQMDAAGVAPDVVTYSTLLSALLPVSQNAALDVVELMTKRGVELTATTCTSILDHLMKQNTETSFLGAFDFLRIMETSSSEDMRPNEITYTVILCGIHRRSRELGLARTEEYMNAIVDKMSRERIIPSKGSYNVLIKTCLEQPEPHGLQHALRYYKEMARNRVAIDDGTRFILLQGLQRRKEWDVADSIINEIAGDPRPRSDSLNHLIGMIRQRVNVRRPTRLTRM